MALQITLRLPNGNISYKTYEDAYALLNPHNHCLEVYRSKMLIASFNRENCIGWEYVVTPQQPTASRAQQLLVQHPQG